MEKALPPRGLLNILKTVIAASTITTQTKRFLEKFVFKAPPYHNLLYKLSVIPNRVQTVFHAVKVSYTRTCLYLASYNFRFKKNNTHLNFDNYLILTLLFFCTREQIWQNEYIPLKTE